MLKVKLHLFDTGYCLNIEKMVAHNKPFKIQRFYALVGLIEHPTLGPILFDTGYSPHVVKLCRKIPYFIYSLITPLHTTVAQSAKFQVQKFGYKPEDIKHIILSHFHPDHAGGLKDFPNAKIHCCQSTYRDLKKKSYFIKLKEIFFEPLLPHDFETRIEDAFKNPINLPYKIFNEGYDIFGDQSIIALSLPGHAQGQFGILLNTNKQSLLLSADACWQSDNYLKMELPHTLAKFAIYDYAAFCTTLAKLQTFKSHYPKIEIIPSHCEKMWEHYVKEENLC